MIVYNPEKPGVYKYIDIYNRATDGDPQTSTKIVPAVGSIIIIDGSLLKIVMSVDPNTLDSTLGDVQFVLADESAGIVNYGHDVLMLYYDTRQSPTRLTVDTKLRLLGENSIGYRIIRTTAEGEKIVISVQLNNEGEIVGEIVPITETAVDHNLECTNGYTLYEMVPGELLKMEVVDSAGVITMEIQLVAQPSTILNTLELASNPIVGFDADCSQIDGDDWVMYIDQNIEELSIFPYVTYIDGSRRDLTIDEMVCYMYGYEDIQTTFPGNRYTIVIKYFLGKDEISTITEEADGKRFLTMTKELVVSSLDKYTFSKVSLVPLWNSVSGQYELRFVGYHQERNYFTDITSTMSYITGFTFNPALYNTQQELRIGVDFTDSDDNVSTYNQTIYLTITAPGNDQPFLIRSTVDGVGYGSENALYNRPKLMYDANLEGYFISSINFPNSTEFLRNFYYAATPPWLVATEIEPPVPTHFTIRDSVSLRPLLAAPLGIFEYSELMSLLSLTTPDAFVNGTVIFEFLTESGSGYNLLYGAPVEVFLSATGYVG